MATTLTYTYDLLSTDPNTVIVSQLRLLMGDTDMTETTTPPLSCAFADQEYAYFWTSNGSPDSSDLELVVCDALMALANDKARLAAYVQMQNGGSVDLRQVASELRAQAQEIRQIVYHTPAEAFSEGNYDDFSYRRLLWTQSLRAAVNTSGPVGP